MLVLLASYRMVRYITLLMLNSSFVDQSGWFFYTLFCACYSILLKNANLDQIRHFCIKCIMKTLFIQDTLSDYFQVLFYNKLIRAEIFWLFFGFFICWRYDSINNYSLLGFLYLNLFILISSAYDPNFDESEILSNSSSDSSLLSNFFNIL